ncbi:polysaccharide pyruvyl transferase family protein [Rhizobium sp. 007]|uniref:polysaccharide pyruvyl transferase family protein n=1 Tax=Rhizobium sp. 007 TaxID=2785056 RepID=UPI00188FF94E|nr:polysaccharide pyruvyl transferase family protein [Rhizobium sp. 007]QPB18711.1 polysaccharide pyruvyl transferase family protein [Rhizobium sp. 007]
MANRKAVLINDTSTKPHLGCRLVVAQIVNLASQEGIEISATSSVHVDWREQPLVQEHMRKADLVIVNGEGTLHDATKQAKALADVAPFCRDAGVACVLINSVFERNDEAIAKACSFFDKIYVRESLSAKSATSLGLRVNVVPDLTISSNVFAPTSGTERNTQIVVTDNANKVAQKEIIDLAIRRKDTTFLNLNTSDLENPFMDQQLRPRVVFSPSGQVTGTPPHRSPGRISYKAFRKSVFRPNMMQRWAMTRDFSRFRPATEILATIAQAKCVVAGRFHAACLCLLADTPFVAVASNTSKTRGMLIDAGIPGLLATDAGTAFSSEFKWGDAEKVAAAEYVARAKRDATAMFRDIASLID